LVWVGRSWSTTTATDDAGNVTTLVADLAGQTVTSSDPNAGSTNFGYDPNGNITSTTDASGVKVNTGYDVLNRPIGRWAGIATSYATSANADRLALSPHFRSPSTTRRREALRSAELEVVRSSLIPDIVDEVIFRVLLAIDQGDLEVFVRSPQSGEHLSLVEAGFQELAGEFIGDDDGWRQQYCAEPWNSFGSLGHGPSDEEDLR